MTANIRANSLHSAVSLRIGLGLISKGSVQTCDSSLTATCGGATSDPLSKALHHFFGQVGKSDPHTRLSPVLRHTNSMGETDLSLDQKNGDGFAKRANAIKPADLVAEAAEWAARLTNEAERKTGKTDTALETVARQTGVNQSTLWRLRYRKPKDLAVSVYMKLKTAWEAAQQRQFERMQHEVEVACLRGESPDDVLLQRIAAAIETHPANPRNTIANGGAGD